MAQLMTVREIRQHASNLADLWTAVEIGAAGYTLRCGDVELCTVNGRKPRVFRTLDAVKSAVKGEIGQEGFRVEFLSS
jgi:hypothetical protein